MDKQPYQRGQCHGAGRHRCCVSPATDHDRRQRSPQEWQKDDQDQRQRRESYARARVVTVFLRAVSRVA
jgi:hypothetical protein